MKPRNQIRFVWIMVITLAIIGVASAVRRILLIEDIIPPAAPAKYAGFDSGFSKHPWLTLIHIIPGALFMILAPLQFMNRIQIILRISKWLRGIFFIIAYGVGITALIMSTRLSIGGANETAATTLFGLLFLFLLSGALRHLAAMNMMAYREWLLRAVAIGLGVATVRPIVGMFFALSSLSPREFFGIAFWIGFTLNLIAAEVWIQHTRVPTN